MLLRNCGSAITPGWSEPQRCQEPILRVPALVISVPDTFPDTFAASADFFLRDLPVRHEVQLPDDQAAMLDQHRLLDSPLTLDDRAGDTQGLLEGGRPVEAVFAGPADNVVEVVAHASIPTILQLVCRRWLL